MVGSFVGLVRDLFCSLRSVFDGVVKGIFGGVYELSERVVELLDRLVFRRDFFKEGIRGSVRFNGYLAHDLLVGNHKRSGESRNRQDVDELHYCWNMEGDIEEGEREREPKLMPKYLREGVYFKYGAMMTG